MFFHQNLLKFSFWRDFEDNKSSMSFLYPGTIDIWKEISNFWSVEKLFFNIKFVAVSIVSCLLSVVRQKITQNHLFTKLSFFWVKKPGKSRTITNISISWQRHKFFDPSPAPPPSPSPFPSSSTLLKARISTLIQFSFFFTTVKQITNHLSTFASRSSPI